MPKQKDFKRLVRTRMQKTGEAYTAARLHILKKSEPKDPDRASYARLAGISDASVAKETGRSWAQWVRLLDDAGATRKSHREIAALVSSAGTRDWWTQMVAVGYERIRGLRARGQRRDGAYGATKSRTFDVPVDRLFEAFADQAVRRRWLPADVTVRTARPHRTLRLTWQDDTIVAVGFQAKGRAKSTVAVEHQKLPTRAAADAVKQAWSDYFDRLTRLLS
jgi:uncharacterized protein YndB with AHSA1/START domain